MLAARSTKSRAPVMVSVSPRQVTRTPPNRESSIRLASFTPASVSGSAPSVEIFCVTVSSLTSLYLDSRCYADVQVAEIVGGNRGGRALEQRARRRRFGKRDHV